MFTGDRTPSQMDTDQCPINVCNMKFQEKCLFFSHTHTLQIKSRKLIRNEIVIRHENRPSTQYSTQCTTITQIPFGKYTTFIRQSAMCFFFIIHSSFSIFVSEQNCKRSHETISRHSIFSWSDIKRLLQLFGWFGLVSKLHVDVAVDVVYKIFSSKIL